MAQLMAILKLKDQSVTTEKIADDAVTDDKILRRQRQQDYLLER